MFLSLDFDDYELVIVNNASRDSSFKVIKEYAEKHRKNAKVKVIKDNRNLGYADGMNIS